MADSIDRSRERLVTVYTAPDELDARMMQEVLANAGIESTLNAEIAPGIYPLTVGQPARQDIMVLESDSAKATRIIAELSELSGAEEHNGEP